jgi:hypothetical protein
MNFSMSTPFTTIFDNNKKTDGLINQGRRLIKKQLKCHATLKPCIWPFAEFKLTAILVLC